MDYPFENLGPERFQEFCQALISTEYSDVQSFPVGQPDGGRDAWRQRIFLGEEIVFQVKYVRKPLAEQAPHEWVKSIAEGEAAKVHPLIEKGAQKYILVTNVPGTAHPGSGSIDVVNTILTETLKIPAVCWWRDDLNRRLDGNYDLKWTYPELMTGPDLIRAIIESGLTEEKERRANAIRTFVRAQYSLDEEVRFKQVELQNKLLDLFVDVPVEFSHSFSGDRRSRERRDSILRHLLPRALNWTVATQGIAATRPPSYFVHNRDNRVGAASFLLYPDTQQVAANIVLEGAPGQGKSTITQYICQVHRMRLLRESFDLEAIPTHHRNSPVRLPFRVDLRDLATWLLRKDPFNPETEEAPAEWEKSLETFLAAQVRYFSGGAQFTVSDLHAIVKISAVVLVFDGLDEIADIKRRREIVEELKKGISRLREISVSLQAIVTSRPAAFANSPGLPDDIFPYFSLTSLNRELVDQYADKWLKARKIQSREAAEVKAILREKLDQPHLRELSRNPMQLAILLSLIHSRGTSLPDKRTALYDAYMELFFSRESTKSEVVRDNRELLLDIHRYLAWTLHSEAEQGRERDKISEERLKKLLFEYLKAEGHDTLLFDQLFTGMIERVVAIVSRVQGVYEFEVQPLREYFAARHLYVTSPYSPAGNERRGTMPDRFDAIARNFYWLNVTRFFAGCLDKGELPALIDRLQVLSREPSYKHTSYPRELAATLLGDWVFTQQPRHLKQAVELVLDDVGMRYLLASNHGAKSETAIVHLPDKCGRLDLIDKCFRLFDSGTLQSDYSSAVVTLIHENANREEILERWMRHMQLKSAAARTEWLRVGRDLGCLSQIGVDELERMISDGELNTSRLNIVFSGKRIDYLEASEARFNATIKGLLAREILPPHQPRNHSLLDLLALGLDARRYATAFAYKSSVALGTVWLGHSEKFDFDLVSLTSRPNYEAAKKIESVVAIIKPLLDEPTVTWATTLAPWDEVVEAARLHWGNQLLLIRFAIVAAAIVSTSESGAGHENLLDSSKSLCRRVRYARLRSGARSWWREQLSQAKSTTEKTIALATLLSWGSGKAISALSPLIDDMLHSLGNDWYSVISCVRGVEGMYGDHRRLVLDNSELPNKMSPLLAAILCERSKAAQREHIYSSFMADYKGNEYWVLKWCQDHIFQSVRDNGPLATDQLDLIARAYASGVSSAPYWLQRYSRSNIDWLDLEAAKKIGQTPSKYPSFLVSAAEKKFKNEISLNMVPVGDIAQRDEWFAQEHQDE